MSRNSLVLLVIFSLTMSIDAASIHSNSNQLTASNTKRAVPPLPQNTGVASRYLRAVKINEKNEPAPEAEERAVPNEILGAMDHAGKVFVTGIYSHNSSFINWLDRLFLKLRYKYWLLKRRTPEDVAKILGLHHVLNIELHPNYQMWLGYLEAYNKKFHKNL